MANLVYLERSLSSQRCRNYELSVRSVRRFITRRRGAEELGRHGDEINTQSVHFTFRSFTAADVCSHRGLSGLQREAGLGEAGGTRTAPEE